MPTLPCDLVRHTSGRSSISIFDHRQLTGSFALRVFTMFFTLASCMPYLAFAMLESLSDTSEARCGFQYVPSCTFASHIDASEHVFVGLLHIMQSQMYIKRF